MQKWDKNVKIRSNVEFKGYMIESMKWSAVVVNVLSALLLSMNIAYSKYGYIGFLLASIVLAYIAIRQKDAQYFTLDLIFSLINIAGVLRWIV